jgi:NADPH-dependent ferric siderophore reductase
MLRILFLSDDLSGFDSPSPDDHIKIFLPSGEGAPPIMRDFTPRAWNITTGNITLDFALHQNGPASEWARKAERGDMLQIGGPRGSTIVPDDFDWYLLIGDATALPSIGRRLESLRSGIPVYVFALVADKEKEQQNFQTLTACQVHWLTSSGKSQEDSPTLRTAVESFRAPEGDGFIWIAAETSVARELYNYVVHSLRHPKEWIKAAGYWSEGQANTGERFS